MHKVMARKPKQHPPMTEQEYGGIIKRVDCRMRRALGPELAKDPLVLSLGRTFM